MMKTTSETPFIQATLLHHASSPSFGQLPTYQLVPSPPTLGRRPLKEGPPKNPGMAMRKSDSQSKTRRITSTSPHQARKAKSPIINDENTCRDGPIKPYIKSPPI